MFVGFMNSIVGNDQTYAGQDGQPYQTAGQFSIANPDGTISAMGVPKSNQQRGGASAAPGGLNMAYVAAAAVIAYVLFKRGKK